MRKIVLVAAAAFLTTAAVAQTSTTVTREEGPLGDRTTVTKERSDDLGGSTTRRSVETTGAVGCESKSVTRTNELGDTTTKTKTEC